VKQDLIIAGVGGQGILTIAQAISTAALKRGLHVKQAEVHGMAQRGGGVQSHLRISDQEIHSDLVPTGQADLLVAVEPLESLRYVHYLNDDGALISSLNVFINIGNYPPVESVLQKIAAFPKHTLVDSERVARAAGSGRSSNIVMLGAASLFLELDTSELEEAVAARERLELALREALRRLSAAGVRGDVSLRPHRALQRSRDRLTGVFPARFREVGPTGADRLPDAGGSFGVTDFDDSTFR